MKKAPALSPEPVSIPSVGLVLLERDRLTAALAVTDFHIHLLALLHILPAGAVQDG